MKIKAINVDNARNLTLKKVYDVIERKENGNFVVNNDANHAVSFKAVRFEILPDAPVTYKTGDTFEDEADELYMLIHEKNLVALVRMKTGEITNGFHVVANTEAITQDEMKSIDDSWEENPLIKVA